jgi:hypothetical protein
MALQPAIRAKAPHGHFCCSFLEPLFKLQEVSQAFCHQQCSFFDFEPIRPCRVIKSRRMTWAEHAYDCFLPDTYLLNIYDPASISKMSSGMLRRVAWQKLAEVSEMLTAFSAHSPDD